MSENNKRILKILDKTIIIFFIVFLLSLTDSIFINQIGYYGALLLIIARGFISKENPFRKTGMEFAFLWFIIAEILSLIFTKEPGNDIIFLLRRVLLIPIVYTTVSSSFDIKRAKLYLKIYLGFSLISVIIYLYFSAQYFMYGLFSIKESGPSIFQYPITVSEITSFTVVILFAFLINEKVNLKNKILLFIAFALSSLALFSTYKRTGWTGAAFGLLVILIIKKKWSVLIPGVLILAALFVVEKNKSELITYDYSNNRISNEQIINTSGRAYDIFNIDSRTCFVCDYQNGLLVFKDNTIVKRIALPAPVISIKKWNDSTYIAILIDTRFILLSKKENNLFVNGEFITPGYTSSFTTINGCLYVLDSDSGLTVFRNPNEINHPFRYPSLTGFESIYNDSVHIILYSPQAGIGILSLQNHLPSGKITIVKNLPGVNAAELVSGRFVASGKNGLNVYNISNSELKLAYTDPRIKNGYRIFNLKERTFFLTSERELFETVLNPDSAVIISRNRLDFTPYSMSFYQNKLYFTFFKQSRLLSIFDPYNPSNFNRIAFWEAGIKMFKDHPVFGVGDIDLANLYRQYKHPWNKEIQGHLHNNFFHILATLGLFGLAAVCFLFFRYLQISFRIYKERIDVPFVSSVALGVIGSFCAFLVSGLTELNFWDHEIATLIWFLFGLNFAFYRLTAKNK
jgi:hypothetical protein